MKRKLLALLFVNVMAISLLAGCGEKEDTQVETTTESEGELVELVRPDMLALKASDYMEDVEYSGIINSEDITVPTDEEIRNTIISYLEYYQVYKHVNEGTVGEDSIVNISYEGTIDDFQFEGGSAENQIISIAESGYIDGFAESIVGANVGDTVTAELKFPDDYTYEDVDEEGNTINKPYTYFDADGNEVELPGKDVTFKITVNYLCGDQILTFDELDDQGVIDMTDGLYQTVDELIQGEKDFAYSDAISSAEMEMWDTLIENFKVKESATDDIQKLYDEAYEYSVKYYENLAQMQEIESPLELFGYETQEEYDTYLKEEAEYIVKRGLIINYIVTNEGLTPSDEEILNRENELAKEYGFDSFEAFQAVYDSSDMVEYIYYEIASDFILEANGISSEK